MNNRVIINLDQARSCGFCVSIGDERVLYGTFITKEKDYHDASNEIKIFLKLLVAKFNPILVTVEDIYGGLSRQTMKQLGILQGVLVNYLIEEHILFQIIAPSTWQSKMGYDKKLYSNTKQWSKKLAFELIGEELLEDTADVVCMNEYSQKFIKIIEEST